MNLWYSLRAWLTRTKPPWLAEAEAMEAAEAERAMRTHDDAHVHGPGAGSCSSSGASLRSSKRRWTAVGIAGVYFVWAVFVWFIMVRPVSNMPGVVPAFTAC